MTLHLIASLQEIHDGEAEEGVKRTTSANDKEPWVLTPGDSVLSFWRPITFLLVFSREGWENRQER